MGFETALWIMFLDNCSNFEAVPMGFETIAQNYKKYNHIYFEAVPMGFETNHFEM